MNKCQNCNSEYKAHGFDSNLTPKEWCIDCIKQVLRDIARLYHEKCH